MKLKGIKKLNKSTGIIIAVAVLFIGAVYLNIRTNGSDSNNNENAYSDSVSADLPEEDTQVSASSGEDYFTAFRSNREAVREREVAYLDDIISDPSTDSETLSQAQNQKLSIIECMEAEFTIESLVLAKGFEDVAVTFHKGSVNVIIDTDTLSQEQVAQILNIVLAETGEPASNIKISARQ